MSRRRLLTLTAAAVLVLMVPAKADTTTYAPPYQAGDSGGDEFNTMSADPATGRVVVIRHNPSPGAFDCGGEGGFSFLKVNAVGPASTVTATFTEAVADGYTWIEMLVKDAAGSSFLAPAAIARGPVVGDGTLTVTLPTPVPAGRAFTVQVGIEVASACPNVDGGTARFTGVSVG